MAEKQRMRDLLEEAAAAMEDGRDPFDHAFLSEHGVTLDEVYDLSNTISVVVRGYLSAPDDVQQEIRLRGSMSGAGMPPGLADTAALFLRGNNALGGIRNHGRDEA